MEFTVKEVTIFRVASFFEGSALPNIFSEKYMNYLT